MGGFILARVGEREGDRRGSFQAMLLFIILAGGGEEKKARRHNDRTHKTKKNTRESGMQGGIARMINNKDRGQARSDVELS